LDEIGKAICQEMSFKVTVYGWMTDGWLLDMDAGHFVTGELKRQY
jgi:hypothetical protein